MKGYSYNYSFLKNWMKKNKKTKSDILNALGTKNYLSLGSWMEGRSPVPVENMLILCNTFLIPMEDFFFFNDGKSSVNPKQANDGDQIEPTGGFNKIKNGYGRNQRRGTQPLEPVEITKNFNGTIWSENWIEREAQMKEKIVRLENEISIMKVEISNKQESISERDKRIEDLRIQARTNEKLVMSLTEQNDFMREQVKIAQSRYQSDTRSFDTMASEPFTKR